MPFPASNGMRRIEARVNLHHLLKQDFASARAPHLCLGGYTLMEVNSLTSSLPQVNLRYTALHDGFLDWIAMLISNNNKRTTWSIMPLHLKLFQICLNFFFWWALMTAINDQVGGVRNGLCECEFLSGVICAEGMGFGMRWVHTEAISRTSERLSAPLRRMIGWDA